MESSVLTAKKVFSGKTAEMHLDDDGIVRIKVHENAEIDVEDIKHDFKLLKELAQNKPVLKLVDSRTICTITPEGRAFAASLEIPENTIARAIIINSLAARITVNFFINFNRPKSPVKLFTCEKEALNWLKSFKRIN